MTDCPSRFGFSQRCRLPAGHDGVHESQHMTWTDEHAATSFTAITNSLRGTRD